jgi:hypothetical protein
MSPMQVWRRDIQVWPNLHFIFITSDMHSLGTCHLSANCISDYDALLTMFQFVTLIQIS